MSTKYIPYSMFKHTPSTYRLHYTNHTLKQCVVSDKSIQELLDEVVIHNYSLFASEILLEDYDDYNLVRLLFT